MEIIVTIGPSSIEPKILKDLRNNGASSFRINLSHANHDLLEEYLRVFESCDIDVCIDTQGAQCRIDQIHGETKLDQDDKLLISNNVENYDGNTLITTNLDIFKANPVIDDLIKVDFEGCVVRVEEILVTS